MRENAYHLNTFKTVEVSGDFGPQFLRATFPDKRIRLATGLLCRVLVGSKLVEVRPVTVIAVPHNA